MKKFALKTYGKITTGLLSFFGMLFGFSGCEGNNNGGMVEYGSPHAEYIVKGTVKSAADSSAIDNMLVFLATEDTANNNTEYYTGSSTDENGEFEIAFTNSPIDSKLKVITLDADSIENGGEFQSDTLEIEFTDSDRIQKGDSNWDLGTYQKENQNFYLKKK